MKLFPAKCHERETLRKLWRQTGNSSLLPAKCWPLLHVIAGISAQFSNVAFVLFCYITNHLMTGPLGNSEFCFPRISMFSSTSSRETLRFSGNKIHSSPRDQSLSVNCLLFPCCPRLDVCRTCCWCPWCSRALISNVLWIFLFSYFFTIIFLFLRHVFPHNDELPFSGVFHLFHLSLLRQFFAPRNDTSSFRCHANGMPRSRLSLKYKGDLGHCFCQSIYNFCQATHSRHIQ